MNPLLLIGGGLLLYYLYSQNQAGSAATTPAAGVNLASQPATTDTATNPTTPPGAFTPATPPSYTGPLQNTYAKVIAAAYAGLGPGGGQTSQSPDVWNYYLMQAFPSITAPDPAVMFPGSSNPHAPIPFATWWSAVVPLLPSGLSGFAPAGFSIPGGFIA